MYCKTCHYDLRKLSSRQCPECGQSFDARDASTFLTNLPPKPDYVRRVIFLLIIATIVAVIIQFLAAARQSGH